MSDCSRQLFLSHFPQHCSKPAAATALPVAVWLLFLLLCLPAVAQQPLPEHTRHNTRPAAQTESKSPRPEPKVERLYHEDTGSRMEELRIEGQSKSVHVQPKTVRVAPYKVDTRPENGSLIHQDSNPTGKTNRSWRLLQF